MSELWDAAKSELTDVINIYGQYEAVRTGSAFASVENQNPVANNGVVRPSNTAVANNTGGTMAPGEYQGESVGGIPKTAVLIGGGLLIAVVLYLAVD